jgi:predicted phosphoribosyltransferase/predicted alpha/beta-hydrolase family hydrolase
MPFVDRVDAGRQLAARLEPLRVLDPIVLALPRGGVPVAAEVAARLGAPLDVLVVRKIGHPRQPELAVGALGEDGVMILDQDSIARLGVTREALNATVARERSELERRVTRYRGSRPRLDVRGRTVIVVDDGLATGASAHAGIAVLRRLGAVRVILAVPVAPADTVNALRRVADDVVCLETPHDFQAVGLWYDDFTQVTDEDVDRLLSSPSDRTIRSEEVSVPAGLASLGATLAMPTAASALVLFAHGSGSSRHSPRNRYVAETLQAAGIGTLLLDLLTSEEEADRRNVFDVDLLAQRLVAATQWSTTRFGPRLPLGYFGASTGAAAALVAAASLGRRIAAVVSRGGRPDLAGASLADVTAPTLLIVGGNDEMVLDLNRRAAARMVRCQHRLVVVPGATHLFEEPGALEAVARSAVDWFSRTLRVAAA